jgi:hypothetical protein
VLFLLFGSSCSGKTTILNGLRGRFDALALHDYDEIGTPPGADTAWRHRTNEVWIQRVLAYQARGIDTLLSAQVPLGEIVASPLADQLDGLAACLVDCDDATRVARIAERGPDWLERTDAEVDDYVNWAAWMREHADDLHARLEVIRIPETEAELRWNRLGEWRGSVLRVDTTSAPAADTVEEVAAWIDAERARPRRRARA